jgi:hypothetical protein
MKNLMDRLDAAVAPNNVINPGGAFVIIKLQFPLTP